MASRGSALKFGEVMAKAQSAAQNGVEETKRFWENKEGTSLRAWFRYFDTNDDGMISFDEFCTGMNQMQYPGDVVKIWKEMDIDGSNSLCLGEIDTEHADLWSSFRRWCGITFDSSTDMIVKVSGQHTEAAKDGASSSRTGARGKPNRKPSKRKLEVVLKRDDFVANLQKWGWKGLFEAILWQTIDADDKGFITPDKIRWVDKEIKRQLRREELKEKNDVIVAKKSKEKKESVIALRDFRSFLIHQYGNFFRAWRKGLDLDGTMTVTRHELFRAAQQMQWTGDPRALWRAIDNDASGQTSLEELDVKSCRLLAHFKVWAQKKYGSCIAAFDGLDRNRSKRLKQSDFIEGCLGNGFTERPKVLFCMLDVDCKRFLLETDLSLLDSWHPPEYLTGKPSADAAAQLRQSLLRKYDSYLAAWREALDRDDSNCVSWQEFKQGAKKVGFKGDVCGAWLHLDDDSSGYISLSEIDHQSAEAITDFKRWADAEMGGVRCAFRILDTDNSGELSLREFRRVVRDYGFEQDCSIIFETLDTGGSGRIGYNEVSFIDDWNMITIKEEDLEMLDEVPGANPMQKAGRPGLITYKTDVPGPGHYNVPAFVATTTNPLTKQSGGFPWASAKKKEKITKTKYEIGPGAYDPEPAKTNSRKPAWGFGTLRRNLRPVKPNSSKSPGPGSYDLVSSKPTRGPSFSMGSRPPLYVHPAHKFTSF